MNEHLGHLYHRLPATLQNLAASMRGWHLDRLRYGAETEVLVKDALARDTWPLEFWNQWRTDKLKEILTAAATSTPFYFEHWNSNRKGKENGSEVSLELHNWPVLEKEQVRKQPSAFLCSGVDRAKMHHEHTSGSTGKPLDLWSSQATQRRWYGLFEARWRRWYGVSLRDRWAILGGQLVTPVGRKHPPFWVWNVGMRQLYMSSYHLSPSTAASYWAALRHYNVRYILGYTSSLHTLAAEAVRLGLEPLSLAVVLTNAEPLYDHQRETLQRAFGCPIRETYGMSEMVAAASECEAGRMHLWPEAGVVEVLDGDQPVPAGEVGDLVCTGLLNPDMLLIRYRVGDRGALAPEGTECACGRTLPILLRVEGRSDDVLYTVDGRSIGRLDPVFKSNLPIREAQIIQESLKSVRVLFVPSDPSVTTEMVGTLARRIRERMGPVEVEFERVESIPRGPNGKFRAVICRLSAAERVSVSRRDA